MAGRRAGLKRPALLVRNGVIWQLLAGNRVASSVAMTCADPIRVTSVQDAARLLAPTFEGAARERLAILYLGADRVVLGLSETRLGPEAAIELPMRPIIADARRLRAASMILAHNHPSGDPEPSAVDVAVTAAFRDAAAVFGIRIEDHLVFAGGHLRSFRSLGLL